MGLRVPATLLRHSRQGLYLSHGLEFRPNCHLDDRLANRGDSSLSSREDGPPPDGRHLGPRVIKCRMTTAKWHWAMGALGHMALGSWLDSSRSPSLRRGAGYSIAPPSTPQRVTLLILALDEIPKQTFGRGPPLQEGWVNQNLSL